MFVKVLYSLSYMLENILSHGDRNWFKVFSSNELLKITSSHVLHHNTSLGLAGEVFFEADYIRTAINTSPHLDLVTYKVFLPFLQVVLIYYSNYKLFARQSMVATEDFTAGIFSKHKSHMV